MTGQFLKVVAFLLESLTDAYATFKNLSQAARTCADTATATGTGTGTVSRVAIAALELVNL